MTAKVTKLDKRYAGNQNWYCYVSNVAEKPTINNAKFWKYLQFCQENFGPGAERDLLYAVKQVYPEDVKDINWAWFVTDTEKRLYFRNDQYLAAFLLKFKC